MPHLVPLWEAYRNCRLVELLCGGGGGSDGFEARKTLLNDINPHLINLFRWVQKGLQVEIILENDESVYYKHRERFNRIIELYKRGAAANLVIRESANFDLQALLNVEGQAFGQDEGSVIIGLVKDLLEDASAEPRLSLVAMDGNRITGHILFTNARIAGEEKIQASLLAPVAVLPELQRKGIGSRLIAEGLSLLSEKGVDLTFVLGHPEYYPRHGFNPALPLGFEAPYPVAEEVSDAWMVRELKAGIIGEVKGKVLCADRLNRPEYWRE